jgi:hypothetical protein
MMTRVGEAAAEGLGMHRIGAADGWDWSLAEVAAFAAAYERYGRNFASISAAVVTKSVRRCVGFYYNVWKVRSGFSLVMHRSLSLTQPLSPVFSRPCSSPRL